MWRRSASGCRPSSSIDGSGTDDRGRTITVTSAHSSCAGSPIRREPGARRRLLPPTAVVPRLLARPLVRFALVLAGLGLAGVPFEAVPLEAPLAEAAFVGVPFEAVPLETARAEAAFVRVRFETVPLETALAGLWPLIAHDSSSAWERSL